MFCLDSRNLHDKKMNSLILYNQGEEFICLLTVSYEVFVINKTKLKTNDNETVSRE